MTDEHNEQDGPAGSADSVTKDTLAQWTATEPDGDFADRVVAARQLELEAELEAEQESLESSGRSLLVRTSIGVGLAAVAIIAFALTAGSGATYAGAVSVTNRETIALGTRAVAVAEPHAELSWTVGPSESLVTHSKGSVFYRVERGGRFVVKTPAGDVTVIGTCFNVEVREMNKATVTSAAVGAAVTATVFLTVYEGKVLFANEAGQVEVSAGESAQIVTVSAPKLIAPGGAVAREDEPSVAASPAGLPAPAADITRQDLLARDADQRKHIASLEQQLVQARESKKGKKLNMRDGSIDWLNPTQEELLALADECGIRVDLPAIFRRPEWRLDEKYAQQANLSDEERQAINNRIGTYSTQLFEEIKALYVEATGDEDGTNTLSLQAMADELLHKGTPDEAWKVRQTIAQERAGLSKAPTNTLGMSPYERYFRMLAAGGHEYEQLLAGVIGAQRARDLREENNGWGMQMGMAGCGED